MKNILKFSFSLLLAVSMTMFMVSCGDDEDIIIDPGAGGINVADGYYIAADGQDPSSTAELSAENVEDDGFTSQGRTGFVGGYVFLSAGDYNIVQITDKELTSTMGGTTEVVTDEGSDCDLNDFTVVSTAESASAFNVASSGLYRVTHDMLTSETILYAIDSPGLMGDATPGGWSTDTKLSGSVDADGGSWSASDLVIRNGQWKVRFNCRWSIDRRADSNAGFMAENGYQMFVNFGGTATDLQNGNDGPNIAQTEEGIYTITVEWDPRSGFSVDLNRTGDAPDLTFDPNDFNWGVIGDATANGWDADRNLLYKFENDVHGWYGVITFADVGQWKFRANDLWDVSYGGSIDALVKGGDNIDSPGAGAYYITMTTADEGMTWQGSISELGWSVIGMGSPTGSWDTDTDMVSGGFDLGITTFTLTGDFTTDQWKFRAGHDWKLSLGENLSPLIQDGGNLAFTEAGTYLITMTFDGANYGATADKQ